MRAALREAGRGVGLTSPNPPVGCVIVAGGMIIGRGWHQFSGGPHAEIRALADAQRRLGAKTKRTLSRATLYVTLEPCSTIGRTAACTTAIIDSGIREVVFSSTDPNPAHRGRAKRILGRRGIRVRSGILHDQGDRMIRPFGWRMRSGMPWVIAKAAVSLDGRITRPRGESQWLTGEAARKDAQKLRRRSEAILVGAETVRQDNPRLTVRGPSARGKEQPLRVVLTRSGDLPDDAALFTDPFKERTIVYKKRGLRAVLQQLADKREVTTVLIEGGGNILAQAFRDRLVNEVCFYVAPFFSGSGKPVIDPDQFRGASTWLQEIETRRLGEDVRISGVVAHCL